MTPHESLVVVRDGVEDMVSGLAVAVGGIALAYFERSSAALSLTAAGVGAKFAYEALRNMRRAERAGIIAVQEEPVITLDQQFQGS